MARHALYLHGFASSAQSKKATFLSERLGAQGITLLCPDLNEPDFSTLTITRMIERIERELAALPSGPVTLFGSSLGGFVAVHVAARQAARAVAAVGSSNGARVDRLVLLAPALEFARTRMANLGDDGVERWRKTNRLEVFHYGYNAMRHVHFALYEDARRYDSFAAAVPVPMLVFQGLKDDAVDPAMVARYAAGRPMVALRMLDDDHQLLQSVDVIWNETAAFLGIPRPR